MEQPPSIQVILGAQTESLAELIPFQNAAQIGN